MADLKTIACEAIDADKKDLRDLCIDIWNNPELGLEENHAHNVLTDFLEKRGFQIERSYKMKTAFRATFDSPEKSSPNVVVIAEYDALPDIGHACGHNLISEVGVGAGVGIMAAMKASNIPLGKLTILGTPAEEGYGGKIDLIEAGAFKDADVAMMSHPFPKNDSVPMVLARESIEITYSGRASHAAAYPWEGVNALDTAVMCYQGVACLRQQMRPTWRVHSIIKEGGVKMNIIPEKAVLHVGIRAPTDPEVAELRKKVVAIMESAASATGCKVEHHSIDKFYSAMVHNAPMIRLYESNMAALLPADTPTTRGDIAGSTDMGNVSHVVPSIHPLFHIGGDAVNHTRDFTDDAGKERAQPYTLIQAKVLAMTAIDIMANPETLKNIKDTFEENLKSA